MRPDDKRLIDKIRETGVTAEAWPDALQALTNSLGFAGAACIISNKATGRIDWVCFSGLSAELESDYVNHYAPLDPYAPLLSVELGWVKLSEAFSDGVLRKSEWYNDFVLACGVRDVLGARVVETPSHFATLGLHQQLGRRIAAKSAIVTEVLTPPLRAATFRQIGRLFTPEPLADVSDPVDGVRYYFHVRNGRHYPDQIGKVFSSVEEAVAHGAIVAAEIAQDRDWDGYMVAVAETGGRIVAEVPVCRERAACKDYSGHQPKRASDN